MRPRRAAAGGPDRRRRGTSPAGEGTRQAGGGGEEDAQKLETPTSSPRARGGGRGEPRTPGRRASRKSPACRRRWTANLKPTKPGADATAEAPCAVPSDTEGRGPDVAEDRARCVPSPCRGVPSNRLLRPALTLAVQPHYQHRISGNLDSRCSYYKALPENRATCVSIPAPPHTSNRLRSRAAMPDVSMADSRRCIAPSRPRPLLMHLAELKKKTPAELVNFAELLTGRKRLLPAQAGHHVRDPEEPRRQRSGDPRRGHAGNPARRLRLPAQPRSQLSARARRHLCQPQPGPPLRPAHRRHGRRPDPRPARRRALLRPAEGRHGQFRAAGLGPPPRQLRQPDAAVSGRAPEDGDGELPVRRQRPGQGLHPARHRPDLPDRQGPARADRRAAAHRQDGDAAEHRHAPSPPTIPKSS